jgi:hypothetical protein
MTGKGSGSGGCCCGSCRTIPWDRRLPTTAIQPMQGLCCRCIPIGVCVRIDEGGYDDFSKVLWNNCDTPLAPANEDPILYSGGFEALGTNDTLNIRYSVDEYDNCYITWDLVTLGLSGSKLIDNADLMDPATDPAVCDGQRKTDCCYFGGYWEVDDEFGNLLFTLTISEPDLIEVRGTVQCGCCNCITNCFCLSVLERDPAVEFTYRGPRDHICATVVDDTRGDCDGGTIEFPKSLTWAQPGGDWSVDMVSNRERPIGTANVVTGTADAYGPCSLDVLLWETDGQEHIVAGDGAGAAEIIYQANTFGDVATRLKWVGRYYAENATLEFQAWNYVTLVWDSLSIESRGRALGVTINTAAVILLDPAHTGTVAPDVGAVQIKLILANGETGAQVRTDKMRVLTESECELLLSPPYGIEPDAWLQNTSLKQSLAFPNNCPDPSAVWEFTATNGIDYLIFFEPLLCGDTCGTDVFPCCNRPLPLNLIATVDLSCVGVCGNPVSVPISTGTTGSIWSGSAPSCGTEADFSVNLACTTADDGSPLWTLDVTQGPGSCSFSGSAVPSDQSCDPLQLVFSGNFDTGLGCCGSTESPFITTIPITVTVTE